MLQLRPEDAAADGEYDMFLKAGELSAEHVHRIRMEKDGLPPVDLEDYSGVITGGGPYNVSDNEAKKPEIQKQFEAGAPEFQKAPETLTPSIEALLSTPAKKASAPSSNTHRKTTVAAKKS